MNTTREYRNYKRMSKMTVRFLEKDESKSNASASDITAPASTTIMTLDRVPVETESAVNSLSPKSLLSLMEKSPVRSIRKSPSPAVSITATNAIDVGTPKLEEMMMLKSRLAQPENGRYINWSSKHTALVSLPWCCVGDLIAFCDKHEYRSLNRSDPQIHSRIASEVKALLSAQAPFDIRKRFPSDTHSPENLWVCIGRCVGVEYHLNRILSVFRKPLDKLSADKQRMVRQDFHLAVRELRLDISARISEVRLYDRHIFENEFHLEWQEEAINE